MLIFETLNPTYLHPEPGATTATATFAVAIGLALTSCTGWPTMRSQTSRKLQEFAPSQSHAGFLTQLRPVSLTCTLATLKMRLAKGGQSSTAQTGAAPRGSINHQ